MGSGTVASGGRKAPDTLAPPDATTASSKECDPGVRLKNRELEPESKVLQLVWVLEQGILRSWIRKRLSRLTLKSAPTPESSVWPPNGIEDVCVPRSRSPSRISISRSPR